MTGLPLQRSRLYSSCSKQWLPEATEFPEIHLHDHHICSYVQVQRHRSDPADRGYRLTGTQHSILYDPALHLHLHLLGLSWCRSSIQKPDLQLRAASFTE